MPRPRAGYFRTLPASASLGYDQTLAVPPTLGSPFCKFTGCGAEECKVNNHSWRSLAGSGGILSRLGTGLLLAVLSITWCQPAIAQESRKIKVGAQPEYPELARMHKIQGSTRLQVVIAQDGTIKDIKVLGGNPVLVQASLEAVKKWKYEPASAESTTIVRFDFKP